MKGFPMFVSLLVSFFNDASAWIAARKSELAVFLLIVFAALIVSSAAVWLMRAIASRLAKKNPDSIPAKILRAVVPCVFWILLCAGPVNGIRPLRIPESVFSAVMKIYESAATLLIVWGALRIVSTINDYFLSHAADGNGTFDKLLIDLLRRTVKSIVWIIALLFVAQNVFALNISAMLAGAGVAGLAIAFAAQSTIANIFGAITLILDKPFKVGDRVIAGGKDGIVETIGLRSTQLRSLDGTLWIVPNKEMADISIENLSRRPNFKQVFDIGLVYGTTPEQMEKGLRILHEIFDGKFGFDMENLPPKIYFTAMKDWSLNLTAIVWFQTVDYFEMLSLKEKANFEIMRRFGDAGLEFAFPSSTTYLAGDSARPTLIRTVGKD